MSDDSTATLDHLTGQFSGVFNYYRRMLDDEFIFASAAQVPQAATIFDTAAGNRLYFGGQALTLAQILALIAYRYGFSSVRRVGHGGYAVVVGHDPAEAIPADPLDTDLRRVIRMVPDHHVQNVLGHADRPRPFDVRLDAHNEPIRDPNYPLLISDVFLLPRHTIRLVLVDGNGGVMQAGGWPAILHCQLLPEVVPLNDSRLDRRMALAAGEMLATALAALGVVVADAHGGNGGVLLGRSGDPLTFHDPVTDQQQYFPVVLDYGYYAEIGPRTLSEVLARAGVMATAADDRWQVARLLYQAHLFRPEIWIDRSETRWKTVKEKSYPPLHHQSRLIYPAFDEILFPQRIETYHIPIGE